MSALRTAAPAPVDQELRWLDRLVDRPSAYARLWLTCATEAGANMQVSGDKLVASWAPDDRHVERGEHLRILTTHMDDAGHRAAVLNLLETARCPAS